MNISDNSTGPEDRAKSGSPWSMGEERSMDSELRRGWLRAQRGDWRTLALVPGDDHTSALDVAYVIARLSWEQGMSIQVADLRDVKVRHVAAFLEAARWEANHGTRIVLATSPTSANNFSSSRYARSSPSRPASDSRGA